ncbi:glycoside hydrolase family 108 protein [Gynuella sunshinyii]|uniref:Putative secretion activating protein n=1 Tax=Gynuella sunshinyii YC6258 TaxID=1445510 RepID=A0A0C5V8W5_9GAMM|nr:glycosyl hydrolase 108 family protein [Gynuella sunshinyii]AJQ95790.1 putative secretion activating protein [Gynuella sunshinyii YC6258]
MADFQPAFELTIRNEGGYVDHTVPGDSGGQTYAGIARKYHPQWPGWQLIDQGDTDNPALKQMVADFYQQEFWSPIKGDQIHNQQAAESIFDFAVNAGVRTSVKYAQEVVGADADGIVGPQTLASLNGYDAELFVSQFALSKVSHYVGIVQNNGDQIKFLVGWLNRTLAGVKKG